MITQLREGVLLLFRWWVLFIFVAVVVVFVCWDFFVVGGGVRVGLLLVSCCFIFSCYPSKSG